MKYYILIPLLFLMSLNSCKKKELQFKLYGKVNQTNTGLNLVNSDIKIYTISSGSNKQELKATTKSDSDGNYEVSIERLRFETLIVKVIHNNHFSSKKTFPIDQLSTSESNEVNHKLSPKSWTKFILKNQTSSDINDHIKIQKITGKTDCEDCCANETQFYHGIIDTAIYCPNDGDTYMKFYWWTLGSNQNNGLDSVYNTPFDTTSFVINY